MKITLWILTAGAALMTSAAFGADSSDRTSPPAGCSERDVNCVVQDGPPRRRGGEAAPSKPAPPAAQSSAGKSATDDKGKATQK